MFTITFSAKCSSRSTLEMHLVVLHAQDWPAADLSMQASKGTIRRKLLIRVE